MLQKYIHIINIYVYVYLALCIFYEYQILTLVIFFSSKQSKILIEVTIILLIKSIIMYFKRAKSWAGR